MTNIDTIEILNNLISYPTVSRDANINLIDYIAELISCDNVKPVIIKNKEKSKANLFAILGAADIGEEIEKLKIKYKVYEN